MKVLRTRRRRRAASRLPRRHFFAERLEPRLLLTSVTSVTPASNSHDASQSTNITARFDQNIDADTATAENFVVHSSVPGRTVTVSAAGNSVTADPTSSFFPGELVQVSASAKIESTSGDPVDPRVWQFRTEVPGGLGTFTDTQQSIGDATANSQTEAVALGDLDGDGDLDAFSVNRYYFGTEPNIGSRVYLNDGAAVFTDSGQKIGNNGGWDVDLGDVDQDGDLDAFVSRYGPNRLYLNDGTGVFTDSGLALGDSMTRGIKLGDLDGDGDLDAFTANEGANAVWKNDGFGGFTQTQSLSDHDSRDVALGDLDNDGDLDAFVANSDCSTNLFRCRDDLNPEPNRVWMNDGTGTFTDSGQDFGNPIFTWAHMVILGDVDSDGDLDAWTGGGNFQNHLYFNNGAGIFTVGRQAFGGITEAGVFGDFDADGDLDIIGNHRYADRPSQLWTNNGPPHEFRPFTESEIAGTGNGRYVADIAAGDLDGDGDLDVYFTGGGARPQFIELSTANVWTNDNPLVRVAIEVDSTSITENPGTATITATVTGTPVQDLVVNLEFSGTATGHGVDYTTTATAISVPRGSTTGSVSIAAVQDTLHEQDETIIVDIGRITGGATGDGQVTISLIDDDDPPTVELSFDSANIAENGGVAALTAALATTSGRDVTVDLTARGSGTQGTDYTLSSTQIIIAEGSTTGTATVTAIDDSLDEADETIVVEIATVIGAIEDGEQSATVTIEDDDPPPTFLITSLVTTSSGFRAEFNADLDTGALNLYDTRSAGPGAADIVLKGATRGQVPGSLVVDSSSSVEFNTTGGPLEPDSYTLVMRSAADGFKDVDGRLLDGDGDGAAGGDFRTNFAVAEPDANSITVELADFVRGPGQDVNLPADTTLGIPLSISEGTNVKAIDLQISYDPAMLEIAGATVGDNMPVGASVIVNSTAPGLLILVFFSTTALPAGRNDFVNLQAAVPNTDSDGIYGRHQILDVHSVTIGDGDDNEFPVVVDDAVHLASYPADVSGNRRVNAADAALVARVAALLDDGFAASPLTDPRMVGDVSGNGRINAADASLIARFAALIDVPEIPPIPSATVASGADVGWLDRIVLRDHRGDLRVETANHRGDRSSSEYVWNRFADRHQAATALVIAECRESPVCADDDDHLLGLREIIDELIKDWDAGVFLSPDEWQV